MTISQRLNKENTAGYIFISLFIIGFLAFTIVPIGVSFVLSFTDYDILSAPTFIGLNNFKEMFQDPTFWQSMGVTFYYALVSVPLRLIFALLVAMVLVRPSKASGVYRAVYYLPSIIGSSVAVAVLWKRLFASDGAINALLALVGLPGDTAWLAQTNTALWVLIILAVWQFGSSMLIFLSGLKQIPVSYYEAATIDGASGPKKFFSITLPMLTPVIFFNLVMQLINGFMAFTQCYIITGGKPLNTTLFYSVYMYQCSFQFNRMGYGCAMAWIMLILVAVMTGILFKTSNKWVYYESK